MLKMKKLAILAITTETMMMTELAVVCSVGTAAAVGMAAVTVVLITMVEIAIALLTTVGSVHKVAPVVVVGRAG